MANIATAKSWNKATKKTFQKLSTSAAETNGSGEGVTRAAPRLLSSSNQQDDSCSNGQQQACNKLLTDYPSGASRRPSCTQASSGTSRKSSVGCGPPPDSEALKKRRRSSVTSTFNITTTKRKRKLSFKVNSPKPLPSPIQDSTYDLSNLAEVIDRLVFEPPEGVFDIDEGQKTGPSPSLYNHNVVSYLKSRERQFILPPDLLHKATPVKPSARAVLVDWLIQVQDFTDMEQETLHMGTAILDFMLSVKPVTLNKVQLLGITSLFIAAKAIERFPPTIKELLRLTEDAYKRKELKAMERLILKALSFDIFLPTPITFLDRCHQASAYDYPKRSQKEVRKMAEFVLEYCMTDHKIMVEPPSLRACAAMWLARKLLPPPASVVWSKTLEFYTGYKEKDVLALVEKMTIKLLRMETSGNKGVVTKYRSKSRHWGVSTHPSLAATSGILQSVSQHLTHPDQTNKQTQSHRDQQDLIFKY